MILFIGAITEEAGGKAKMTMDAPRFEYWYGVSFILTVISFSCSELTGVLSVYLYISRHKHAYRKKVEGIQSPDGSGGGALRGAGVPGTPEEANSLCPPVAAGGSSRPCNGGLPANNNSFYSFVNVGGGAAGNHGGAGNNGGARANGGSREALNDVLPMGGLGGGEGAGGGYRSEGGRGAALGASGRCTSNNRLSDRSAAADNNYRRTTPV